MAEDKEQRYDVICFSDLAYEFEFSDKKQIEGKIKQRIKYYKLGDYNQDRVNYLRQLKNDLYTEISSGTKSKYFHQSKSTSAALNDFNVDQMTLDYVKKYDKVDGNDMKSLINFAVYLYYMR